MKKNWVINTKPHINTPETVVKYLGRYTYRTAISLSRIQKVTENTVSFKWLDYRDNEHKTLTLDGVDFLQRFLSHVLPKGLMRIRHSLQCEADTGATLTPSTAPARYADQEKRNESLKTTICLKCKKGQLRLVGEILSPKRRQDLTQMS